MKFSHNGVIRLSEASDAVGFRTPVGTAEGFIRHIRINIRKIDEHYDFELKLPVLPQEISTLLTI